MGERTWSLLTVIPCAGENTRFMARGTKFIPLNVIVTVEPAAAWVGLKLISEGGLSCACAVPQSARHSTARCTRLELCRRLMRAWLRFIFKIRTRIRRCVYV